VKNAKVAAILRDVARPDSTIRLQHLLNFLGIDFKLFNGAPELLQSVTTGSLAGLSYSVIGPLSAIRAVLFESNAGLSPTVFKNAHSFFAYMLEDSSNCSILLQSCIGGSLTLRPVEGERIQVKVSNSWPDLTGPMHGIAALATARPSDYCLQLEDSSRLHRIIDVENGTVFFEIQRNDVQLFVSCSCELPDLAKAVKAQWYDVKDDFLSAVPALLYLKWAFRGQGWQASESGACLIIDDPILRMQYGFCNFPELDKQMQKHAFTTNIAVIPWNWRRTSADMAALVRKSKGRLSISVHGCDHTGAEFGSISLPVLNSKAAVAKQRMAHHQARTGVPHDLIMIFPQGVFSRESLEVLHQHGYLAAVNTEISPVNVDQEPLTIKDLWSVAVTRYGGLPFFVRRYPAHGLENFAFDNLLGKPCLIVEHHNFFKGNGEKVVDFVGNLNSLNLSLKWRGLGDVLRRSYQQRAADDGIVDIRMFVSELLLRNDGAEKKMYRIEKADSGNMPIAAVLVNDAVVDWQKNESSISFQCEIAPDSEVLLQVQYQYTPEPAEVRSSFAVTAKVAGRRYLSEVRDNFLSRHEHLLQVAQKAKVMLTGH
jgi:hypothetical protein